MRVLLCERHPDGTPVVLKQIFRDGKLVWDASSGLWIGQAVASSESSFSSSAVLYQGEDTQMPDPYEEQFDGVGNAPPFRDFATISLRFVECPGGRVPQFSFVFSNNCTTGMERGNLFNIPALDSGLLDRSWGLCEADSTISITERNPVADVHLLHRIIGGNGYASDLGPITLPYRGTQTYPLIGTKWGSTDAPARAIRTSWDPISSPYHSPSTRKWVETIDLETGQVTSIVDFLSTDAQHDLGLVPAASFAFDAVTGLFAACVV